MVGIRAIIDPFAHAGDISLNLSDVVVSDSIGGSIWIDTLGTGFISVYPGYLEPPQNLVATGGLDGVVPLMWEEPTGGVGLFTYSQRFEFYKESPWKITLEHAVDNNTGGWLSTDNDSVIPCSTCFNTGSEDQDNVSAVAIWSTQGFEVERDLTG